MMPTQETTRNQVQQSLFPMFRIWSRSIGWTIIFSTLVAVLFSLALDGCSSIASQHYAGVSHAVTAPRK